MHNKKDMGITSLNSKASQMQEKSHQDRRYILFLFTCVFISILPFIPNLRKLPTSFSADAIENLSVYHVIADAIRNYGEYPIWNPYFGGGIPWAGSVYNTGLSLVSLFYIVFGEIIGVKLWIFTIMFLGSYGMYATVRGWFGLKPSSALIVSLIYTTSAWLPGVLRDDYNLMGFFTLPFFTLCMLRLLQKRWLGLLLPVCFMVAFGEAAKVWPFVIAGTVLIVAIVYRVQSGRTAGTIIGMWALGFGAGLVLAAPKLIPMWDLMKMDLVDQVASREWICYAGFAEVARYVVFPGFNANIQVGVGIAGAFFAVCGILLDMKRSLGLLGILVAAVICGVCPNFLIRIMTIIPVINKVGSYGMYASPLILFCICGLAAIGFERLRSLVALSRLEPKGQSASFTDKLIIVFAAGSIIYSARFAMRTYGTLFTLPDFSAPREMFYQVSEQALVGVIDRYRQTPEDHILANQYYNIRRGVGTITWYGNMVFPEYTKPKVLIDANGLPVLQQRYLGEAYCLGSPGNGCTVSILLLTYNTIRLQVNAIIPSTVVLNFNYNSGWHAASAQVTNHAGLLALQVPTDTHAEVTLRFSDDRFTLGLVLALIMAVLWTIGGIMWVRKNSYGRMTMS